MLLLLACTGARDAAPDESASLGETAESAAPAQPFAVRVHVTLDGQPAAGTTVLQGGAPGRWTTDADGYADVEMDPSVVGDQYVLAAHPDARIDGAEVEGPVDGAVEIALTRFDPSDNPDYTFADPGPASHEESNSSQCVHCHPTLHDQWSASPHHIAASDPALQDLYQGLAAAFSDADTCATAGGTWGAAVEPGTGAPVERCIVATGVREATGGTGACADCHAPGIDGQLGGRDLLDATGIAYDDGVHCDVCHKVESVDMDAPAGVAGRLHVVRPSEPGELSAYAPLSFGPLADVINPNMGAVLREDFHEPELCGGCHELWQDADVDLARWPEGKLPVHTTYGEWEAGPMNPAAPCQSCHMPPVPGVGNSADLYDQFDVLVGVVGGWERPAGEVRAHSWVGPRQRDSQMLELAATVSIDADVVGDELVADVTVKNVGPGHAIPTGEPLRSLVLFVEATCDGEPLRATGGAAIPDFGGALATGTDPVTWPGASVGDVIRAVRRTGDWWDYTGYGPFGDGTFDAAEKGMPVEEVVGEATVVAVDGDTVTLDADLPAADVYYRGEAAGENLDGDTSPMVAGAPGFAFARVLVDADGDRMAPHFEAVDVASDNRLLPQQDFTTEHRFAATCADPHLHAVLVHRAYPPPLARARGWALTESVMAEATW